MRRGDEREPGLGRRSRRHSRHELAIAGPLRRRPWRLMNREHTRGVEGGAAVAAVVRASSRRQICSLNPRAPHCLCRLGLRHHACPPETATEAVSFGVTRVAAAGATAGGSGYFCRRRDWNSSPLPLEVAAGLPSSRFGDRRCFGLAVPSSVRVVEIVEKSSGAELLVAVTSG
ncbi:uncharacterized protein DS421_19g661690 [Arachis hypogaea]|uniref:Uncharacterized protein n=1 Tax=Arachis hypogaea TaxID=3818 RepID=A0A6B9VCN3_ARAHY|nr:uncharacterized protein DS421_19g661690 [Arachis hypogaea]